MSTPSMPGKSQSPEPADSGVQPYIPADVQMQECTPRAIILGAILGAVFGASSLYLVLKVGITVSASIPVAVISLALFRIWSKMGGRDATILENNIVQTAGSAGESIAFGLGVTMPAILILGFDLEITRVMLVALLGGLLGILMMIPLRRALIVQQHKELKYPEGTACAEVLKAGANEESRAMASAEAKKEAAARAGREQTPSGATIFAGFGIGLVYNVLMDALKGWKHTPEKIFGAPLKAGSIATEVTPELLGVGYIIGPRIGAIMMGGGVLSYLVLIPMIKFFGDGMTTAVAPATKLIKDMEPGDIRGKYILYIGAGAVAAGGIISLLRSGPTILRGIRSGLSDFGSAAVKARANVLRTDRDLSMKFVAIGCLVLVAAILAAPSLHMNIAGAILILIFGFLFVTVSSRLTGEIGSSSNPISGMTVATLLLTSLLFLLFGMTDTHYYVTALLVGGIVCIAASNGGSTSQDLKTGYLLGATPRNQQIAILIGAAASALVLGSILLGLNQSKTTYFPADKVGQQITVPVEKLAGLKPEYYPQAGGLKAALGKLFGQGADLTLGAPRKYFVWYQYDPLTDNNRRLLVDDTGKAVWLVDPGINGEYQKRLDGTEIHGYDAPKARLMSYIVKGILDRKLPWGLVLFGVMISVVLELAGIPSLAFAVGVYLPISSSAPIFVGGMIRLLVDRKMRARLSEHQLSEDQLNAESDKSPGVLLASGYIAGGAIAGIIIAFMMGVLPNTDAKLDSWSSAHNLFYGGPNADWLALIPFAVLGIFLYLVGHGTLMSGRKKPAAAPMRR